MAEKDITQKILEANNDVFADIVNGLMFNGKQVVQEDELQDLFSISAYENEAKLYSMERDVSKLIPAIVTSFSFFRHSTKDCGRRYNIGVVKPLTFVWFCSTISVVSL